MIADDGNVLCDTCGKVLGVGEYPFCPHGFGDAAIQRDEIPGGILLENYGPHPIRFYSYGEIHRYQETHGLHEREKFSPMPGTDIDPQGIPNPAGYKDPQTLLNAAELICRNGQKTWDAQDAGVLRLWPTRYGTNEEAIDAQVKSRS